MVLPQSSRKPEDYDRISVGQSSLEGEPHESWHWSGRDAGLLFGLVAGASPIAHAQQSVISGTEMDAATGDALENARVVLVGPNRIEGTNREGRYSFCGVEPGSRRERVCRRSVDQLITFRNRLFLTAELRLDDNSAFGKTSNTRPLPINTR